MSAAGANGVMARSPELLHKTVAGLLQAAGCGAWEASMTADHLVEANLQGHDSHGVGMAPAYVRNIRSGTLKPNQRLHKLRDAGALMVFDGGHGMGQVMAHSCMEAGIERARQRGSCLVLLRDSHHVGRLGHWAEQAATVGAIALIGANVPRNPRVAPYCGRSARLGTNPLAIGIPRPGRPPVIVDFATSRFAVGKVRVAMNRGERLPEGVLLDASGEATTDPSALFSVPAGALLPVGEHKGFGLALAVELLAGALSGGEVADGSPGDGAILNSLFAFIVDPEQVGGMADFAYRTESFLTQVATEDDVLIPGEPERRRRAERIEKGVPLDARTHAEIQEAARSVGFEPPAEF
jgi:hydroxycarboxylate dehydrogenase B